MIKFTQIIRAFINGIAKSRVSLIGATMTTASFPILMIGVILELFGLIHSQYFGFVLYMFIAPAFILGLYPDFSRDSSSSRERRKSACLPMNT